LAQVAQLETMQALAVAVAVAQLLTRSLFTYQLELAT
jgi:hypothetical protein